MPRQFIMHIDEAPYRYGEPRKPGEPIKQANQLIGDLELGPWAFIMQLRPGHVGEPHHHDADEFIFILEGDLTLGERKCGPGTLIFNSKGSVYGFKVGEQGVRFLNIRPNKDGFYTANYVGKASEKA